MQYSTADSPLFYDGASSNPGLDHRTLHTSHHSSSCYSVQAGQPSPLSLTVHNPYFVPLGAQKRAFTSFPVLSSNTVDHFTPFTVTRSGFLYLIARRSRSDITSSETADTASPLDALSIGHRACNSQPEHPPVAK